MKNKRGRKRKIERKKPVVRPLAKRARVGAGAKKAPFILNLKKKKKKIRLIIRLKKEGKMYFSNKISPILFLCSSSCSKGSFFFFFFFFFFFKLVIIIISQNEKK